MRPTAGRPFPQVNSSPHTRGDRSNSETCVFKCVSRLASTGFRVPLAHILLPIAQHPPAVCICLSEGAGRPILALYPHYRQNLPVHLHSFCWIERPAAIQMAVGCSPFYIVFLCSCSLRWFWDGSLLRPDSFSGCGESFLEPPAPPMVFFLQQNASCPEMGRMLFPFCHRPTRPRGHFTGRRVTWRGIR